MALTTEQVLILNNLMYMSDDPLKPPEGCEGQTVGEWLEKIDVSQLDDSVSYSKYTTGSEWKDIIQAAKNDETLMNMTIADTHTDSAGGGGKSVILTSSSTNDAVVVFKGTANKEWGDNFTGGNVTDTPYQKNALEWYQSAYREHGLEGYEITITGHSKGGNKAKYITLLDDSVDHCVSFDGQGFSDEFMEKYADQIAGRQSLIENHNVDYDYVNLLLNDVGKSTFYKGHNIGEGGFLENHCPNTFMKFSQDGNFTLTAADGQAPEMKALDEFLNNLIRSMPEGQQTETLACINVIVDSIFSLEDRSADENLSLFVDLLSDSKYSDELAYVLAYVVEYEQANPEFADQIKNVLNNFGMGDFTQYVDMVVDVLNFDEDYFLIGHVDFDRLYKWVTGVANIIPDWLFQKILDELEEKYGVKLTMEQLKNLLKFAGMVYDDMQDITIKDKGGDITVDPVAVEYPSHSGVGTHGRVRVEPQKMRTAAEELMRISSMLSQVSVDVEELTASLSFSQRLSATSILREKLRQDKRDIDRLMNRSREIGNALTEISGKYESTENMIVGFF